MRSDFDFDTHVWEIMESNRYGFWVNVHVTKEEFDMTPVENQLGHQNFPWMDGPKDWEMDYRNESIQDEIDRQSR